jgi:hypothetical protein
VRKVESHTPLLKNDCYKPWFSCTPSEKPERGRRHCALVCVGSCWCRTEASIGMCIRETRGSGAWAPPGIGGAGPGDEGRVCVGQESWVDEGLMETWWRVLRDCSAPTLSLRTTLLQNGCRSGPRISFITHLVANMGPGYIFPVENTTLKTVRLYWGRLEGKSYHLHVWFLLRWSFTCESNRKTVFRYKKAQ